MKQSKSFDLSDADEFYRQRNYGNNISLSRYQVNWISTDSIEPIFCAKCFPNLLKTFSKLWLNSSNVPSAPVYMYAASHAFILIMSFLLRKYITSFIQNSKLICLTTNSHYRCAIVVLLNILSARDTRDFLTDKFSFLLSLVTIHFSRCKVCQLKIMMLLLAIIETMKIYHTLYLMKMVIYL